MHSLLQYVSVRRFVPTFATKCWGRPLVMRPKPMVPRRFGQVAPPLQWGGGLTRVQRYGRMDKAPKSRLELRRLVLAALRKVPGCQGVEDVTIEPLIRSGNQSGWVVSGCAPGSAAVVDCKRALAPIQDLFRQMYQLAPAMNVGTLEDAAACIDHDRRPLDQLIKAAPALRALAETTLEGKALPRIRLRRAIPSGNRPALKPRSHRRI